MIFTITVPSRRIFEAYWYGYGDILSSASDNWGIRYVVNYGTDRYRAECQHARFASGLYFGTLTDNDDNDVSVQTTGTFNMSTGVFTPDNDDNDVTDDYTPPSPLAYSGPLDEN
jgi:hypothetical protein